MSEKFQAETVTATDSGKLKRNCSYSEKSAREKAHNLLDSSNTLPMKHRQITEERPRNTHTVALHTHTTALVQGRMYFIKAMLSCYSPTNI